MKARIFILVSAACVLIAGGIWYWTWTSGYSRELNALQQPAGKPSAIVALELRKKPTVAKAHNPSANYSPSALPPSAGKVMNPSLSYRERILALKNFHSDLAHAKIEDLISFLKRPDPKDNNEWVKALKNSIMDYLCESGSANLQNLFIDIYKDSAQDPVIRDYALQHLIECALYLPDPSSEPQTEQALWQAVRETDSSIAGTALLGLQRLSASESSIDATQLSDVATAILTDANAGDLSRTTAIQVCAQMQATNALPAIRQMAESSDTLPLQVSALAALGLMNDTVSVPFLENVLNGPTDSLKAAAAQALNQIADYQHQAAEEVKQQLEQQKVNGWKQKGNSI